MGERTVVLPGGPFEVQQTTREAVAFKLMEQITSHEPTNNVTKDRKYWLTLYHQCYKATRGDTLDNILKQD